MHKSAIVLQCSQSSFKIPGITRLQSFKWAIITQKAYNIPKKMTADPMRKAVINVPRLE